MSQHSVSAIIYRNNPNGCWIVGVFIVCLAWFFVGCMSMNEWQILVCGGMLLAFFLYIKYGNNPLLQLRSPDKRRLVFSSEGVAFGLKRFPVSDIEAVAFYLDAFSGFEYREATPSPGSPSTYVRSYGDKSKVSFRSGGQVTDFTFCLPDYAAFATLRWVMTDWQAAGVNVVWKQAFEDDYILQEMAHFGTSSGLLP